MLSRLELVCTRLEVGGDGKGGMSLVVRQCVPVDDRDRVPVRRRAKDGPCRVSWQVCRSNLLFQPHVSSTRAGARWSTRAAQALELRFFNRVGILYRSLLPLFRSHWGARRDSCDTSSSREPPCTRIPAVVNMEDAGFRHGNAPPTAPRQQTLSFDLTPMDLVFFLPFFASFCLHTVEFISVGL